jgi:phosphatidylglycerol---prolipoprotein diacylglyceryl transferase
MLTPPDIDPVALHLGPLQIHWYGITYVIAFATAWWLARVRAARAGSGWTAQDVDDLIFWSMVGVILGGRVGYVLFYGLSFWAEDPFYPLRVWQGGMSFHGGLVGVLIALALFAKRRHRAALDVMDFTAPIVGLGFLAGRMGNFINGELWGKVTDVPWAFAVATTPGGAVEGRHPSQLYEGFLEGLVLFVLVWVFSSRRRPSGAVVGLALLWYGLARFAVEFVRVPDAHLGYMFGDWFTRGQLLSLPMIIGGIALLFFAYRPSSQADRLSA